MSEINEKTQKVDPELLSVPEIRQAIELTEEAAYTPAELAAYETYWDTVSTEKTLLNERYELGKVEGETIGEAKGEARRNLEIAKAMLAKNMAISLIAEVTGLTETEIQSLRDN